MGLYLYSHSFTNAANYSHILPHINSFIHNPHPHPNPHLHPCLNPHLKPYPHPHPKRHPHPNPHWNKPTTHTRVCVLTHMHVLRSNHTCIHLKAVTHMQRQRHGEDRRAGETWPDGCQCQAQVRDPSIRLAGKKTGFTLRLRPRSRSGSREILFIAKCTWIDFTKKEPPSKMDSRSGDPFGKHAGFMCLISHACQEDFRNSSR